MQISRFVAADISDVTAAWNAAWHEVPRAFPALENEVKSRVLDIPAFPDSELWVARCGDDFGFVHFGPHEEWWFLASDRVPPRGNVGVIYALCAANDALRDALLEFAESSFRRSKSSEIWLWPTWAQGTVPFYNGLTPSNEVSGQWTYSPLVEWAENRDYKVVEHYHLAVLNLETAPFPTFLPQESQLEEVIEEYSTPLAPGAKRLKLTREEQCIALCVLVEWPERARAVGDRELAAFDVVVNEPHRGQGWGKVLMHCVQRYARNHHYDAIQLHLVVGNQAAERLYFGFAGFTCSPEQSYVSLRKSL